MKKSLLLILSIVLCFGAIAQQVKEYTPNGFRRANVPAALKNLTNKVQLRKTAIDNQAPSINMGNQNVPLRKASLLTSPDDEYLAGNTIYDLQTNNAISNRLSVNDDGTISAAWTFSPDGNVSTSPIYPNRGTGYNYWDGTNWLTGWLYPNGPLLRQEGKRTGFTNVVVTPISELLIAHSAVGSGDSNQIAVSWRATRGSGAWTLTFPWGHAHDTWPKACGAGTSGSNNNVYVIFQGSGTATSKVAGQSGPLYFSKSTDGGQTWTPRWIIPATDSSHYAGFGGDAYSIDAKGDTVAIVISETYTDLFLLKSTDAGATWTKTIIQKAPIPFFATCNCGTYYYPNAADTALDTVHSNSGDGKVLLDNAGMAHVWFSVLNYYNRDSVNTFYTSSDDDLFYWNETMPADTGGAKGYVSIASAQDFNNNAMIDIPTYTFTTCSGNPYGNYGGGLTQMPSAGIDAEGRIFLSYQTVAEYPSGDTAFYHELHRHIYIKTLAPVNGIYNPADWTNPVDIIPTIAELGDGFNQEGVFACTGRHVDNNYDYILYERDNAPGHSLAAAGTCDHKNNYGNTGNSSDIVLFRMRKDLADGVQNAPSNNVFVSQNYPNPATGITYVNFGLKKSASVKVEVYDLIGKVVFSESLGQLPAGPQNIHFDTSKWENGVYTYSIIAGGEKSTRQMIVQ